VQNHQKGEDMSSSDFFPHAEACPRRTIFPGVEISTWWGERLMCSYVEMQPHAVVEEHFHPHEQMGMVLEGKAIFIVGGVQRTLEAGDRYRIPGNVPHRVLALDQPFRALDVFSPPREEYK
jgi:quercetin dioxygenase-like cupin family protein